MDSQRLYEGPVRTANNERYEVVCTNPTTPHHGHAPGATKCVKPTKYEERNGQLVAVAWCGYSVVRRRIS